jgi:hypothetical protein
MLFPIDGGALPKKAAEKQTKKTGTRKIKPSLPLFDGGLLCVGDVLFFGVAELILDQFKARMFPFQLATKAARQRLDLPQSVAPRI